MNYKGIVIGVAAFLIIGGFHPLVIWAEYHFTKKIWPLFGCAGVLFAVLSLLTSSELAGSILAILAAGCIWSIRELFQQEKRVEKGWFPKKRK